MSKMNELSATIDELIKCGNGLIKAAESLRTYLSSDEETETVPAENTSEDTASEEPEAPIENVSTYSKEDVRKICSAKAAADDGKYKVQVREMVKKYAGGGSLGAVNPDDYQALIKEVEAI